MYMCQYHPLHDTLHPYKLIYLSSKIYWCGNG